MAKARKHWPQNHSTPLPEDIEVDLYLFRGTIPVRVLRYKSGVVSQAEILEYDEGQWKWARNHDYTNVPDEGARKVTKKTFNKAVTKYCEDNTPTEQAPETPAP